VYGGYDYKVRRSSMRFKNLPSAFDGLKILQVSDIHSGSFTETHHLAKAVDLILAQKADIIFFTGDLVNNSTDEVYPFMETLKRITAPMGVMSTMGNHDYGDYKQWDSDAAKAQNLTDFYRVHKDLGWDLLRNENRILQRGEDKIAIVGVENWGAAHRFPKYGDLDKASCGTEDIPFRLLLSHDPSHWDAKVRDFKLKMDLMLAGHTHGGQFGVEARWLKWSWIEYAYKQWAGLYKNKNKYLYVNRGLGFLGYPGRAGIRPEITVIELKKA
jgi:predicted MPP superfamily phosphohydrolase